MDQINRKFRIVIVEDDEDEQGFIKQGFEKSGLFEILQMASDGGDFIAWIKERQSLPDAILSDLNMPGKNGHDIIKYVRNAPGLAHIPLVIMSTSFTQMNRDRCLQAGASAYLNKPATYMEYEPFAFRVHKVIDEIIVQR